jgi:TP901 family phage tail tape measure protein
VAAGETIGLEAFLDMRKFDTASGRYSKILDDMNRQTDKTAGGISSQFNSLGKHVLGVAAGLGTAVVAGAAAAGAAVAAFTVGGIKSAMDMEAQLSGIAAVLNLTKAEVEPLSELIVELGLSPDLKVTSEEAAAAIEMLARNGLTMSEILDGAAESTVLLANATGGTFAESANIATDAMAIFKIEAKDMMDAVDGIVSVTTASKFSISDYALALAQGGGVAAAVGVNFQDFNTSIAAVSPLFKSGSDAGTSFKTFLQRLVPQTDKAAGAMADLGLEFFNADGSMKSMSEISQELNKALLQTRDITVEVGGRTAEQSAELDRLQGIYARTVQSIGDYDAGIKGASLTEEARAKKIAELNTVLANTQAQMDPLLAITGEMTTATKKLTQEELNRALTTIFGTDAMRTAIALAESGAVVYETAAEAAQALGVSIEEIGTLAEDGITEYEALMIQMGQTSALESAKTRMDNLAGIMEIVHGIFEAVQLQIGQYFLPLLTDLSGRFRDLAEDAAPKVIAVFQRVASFIGDFITSLLAGEGIMVAFFKGLREADVPGDVIGKLITFATNVQNVVTAVQDFVTKHADAFRGALIGIGAVLAGAAISVILGGIATALLALVTGIGPVIALMAALGAAVSTNFAGMGDAVSAIVAAVQAGSLTWALAWEQIAKVAGNIWAMIQPHLITLWTNITAWFGSIDWVATAQAIWDGVVAGASRLWEFILPHLQALQVSIIDWFITVDWAAVGQAVATGIGQGFTNLGAFLQPHLQTLGQTILGWLGGLAEQFGLDWVKIQAVVGTAWAVIKGVIDSAVAVLGPAIRTFVSGIVSGFSSFGPVLDAFGNLWTTIQPIVMGVLAAIGAVLLGLVGIVVGVVNGIAQAIQPLITTFGLVLEGVINFVNGLIQFVTAGNDFLVGIMQGDTEKIRQAWARMGEGITNLVTGLVQAVVSLWVGLITTLQSFAEGLVNGIIDFFTHLYDELIGNSIITDMIADILVAVMGWRDDFLDLVDQLIGDSIRAFLDRVSDFVSAGAAIIAGLVEGVSNAAQSLISAVVGVAQSAVSAVTDFLGIESPSTVFMEIGRNMGLGIVEGLMDSAEDIQSAMEGMMDFAGTFSSLGSTAASMFKKRTLDPLQDELDQATAFRDRWADGLVAELGLKDIVELRGTIGQQMSRARQAGDTQLLHQLEAFVRLDNERRQLAEEYAEQQERILKLQEAQQDLQFLEQQMKLLDLIAEHGLDASILEGLQLGIDADAGAVVDAMAQAIQAIIDQAEGQLGIASPSRIFTRIGEFVNEGLAQGLSMLRPVESAMSQLDRAMTGMGMDLPGMANAAYSRLGGASLPAGPAGPSMVTLDPASLRALQTGSVSNSRTYQLNTSTRESQMSLRQQFRLMEMIE